MDVHDKPPLSRIKLILFTILQVITGLDYGFAKILSKKLGILLKVITIVFSVHIAVVLSKPFLDYEIGLFYYVMYSVEYQIYCLILIFSNYTLYEYVMEFEELDSWTENRRILRDVVMRAVLLPCISVVFKIILSVVYCAYAEKREFCALPLYAFLMKVVSNYAFDSLLLVQYLIMYTYYRHMSNLKSKVVEFQYDINKILRVYKNILDSVDKIKPVCDKLIMTSIVLAVPRFMATEYMVLREVKMEESWVVLVLQYAIVLEMGILMCLPSLTAEAANTHADEMTLTLHNILIDTTDQQKRFKIQQTLVYMSARPSQLYVWRRVPVDARLPMAIISLMTTYLIVIVQFTHLFD